MKSNRIAVWLLIVCLCVTGCGGQNSPPEESEVSLGSSESSEIVANDFETLLNSIDKRDLVVESIDGSQCTVNLQLVLDWIQSYREGGSNTLALYYDGGGFPSTLFLLESDGSKEYSISSFSSEPTADPITYKSSLVFERELDYVFATDTDMMPFPTIHKKPIVEQSISTDIPALDDAAKEGILQIAEKVFDKLPNFKPFCNSAYISATSPAAASLNFLYQVTGQATIAGKDCILVAAYSSAEEMSVGVESGNILAVSRDNALCFSKDVANGGWIFAWDSNEKPVG